MRFSGSTLVSRTIERMEAVLRSRRGLRIISRSEDAAGDSLFIVAFFAFLVGIVVRVEIGRPAALRTETATSRLLSTVSTERAEADGTDLDLRLIGR
ncbi:MAG TPA: hypothetical protein VNM92_00130 [Thermoanaerobaculia bacterium]|nr:hypothetical protein [Thermoanaerobaculia bacterium]